MCRVEGKVALVTGGAKGIGGITSELLAREGAAVAIADVDDDAGRELAERLQSNGAKARYWHLDVTDEDNVRRVFTEVVDEWGRLDVLVNNAGIAGSTKPTDELTVEEWERVMRVNVKGVFLCTKHAIPLLRRAGGGSIVNLSSIYGLIGAPDFPPYHASKGAVRLMTKTDALLYAAEGIRVNSVHPGFIWTSMVQGYLDTLDDPEGGREALNDLHPLGHIGEPADIGYGILYLASDESKFMTGAELVIDGGYTAR